jgi:1,4-dihydroxy-6-naphthoate synthase
VVSSPIRLGISTCPNDTFAFHALLTGAVAPRSFEIEFELLDVQELNEALAAGRFDAAKGSFHAAFKLANELCVLRPGSALGFGNGPLLLAPGRPREFDAPRRVLGPGRLTTAQLLMQLYHPEEREIEHVIFSGIMPALEEGEADLGVCIHEGRFTWEQRGLQFVEDLGQTWQQHTSTPLPLGGIFARKALDRALIAELEGVISASISYARAHPEEALISMRRHAQEQSDEVLAAHVELYVNEHTSDLGPSGRAAIGRLQAEARLAGVLPADGQDLEVFGD